MWGVFRVINSNNRQPSKQTWSIISTSDSKIQWGGTVVSATQAEVECDRAMAKKGEKDFIYTKKTSKENKQKLFIKM